MNAALAAGRGARPPTAVPTALVPRGHFKACMPATWVMPGSGGGSSAAPHLPSPCVTYGRRLYVATLS